jgi:hypothetical protein
MQNLLRGISLLLVTFGSIAAEFSNEPPEVPVGADAYLQWDRWAYQRIGVRAYMRSTYDRSGGNEGADASIFFISLQPIITSPWT